jgi:hypothetical protein
MEVLVFGSNSLARSEEWMSRTVLAPRKSPSQRRSEATVEAIVEGAIRVLINDGMTTDEVRNFYTAWIARLPHRAMSVWKGDAAGRRCEAIHPADPEQKSAPNMP